MSKTNSFIMIRKYFYSLSVFLAVVLLAANAYGQNNPPILDPLPDTTITESMELAWRITANDADGNGDITLTMEPPDTYPAYLDSVRFVDSGNGVGSFVFATGFNNSGVYPITFFANDNIESVSINVTITVLDSNPPPVLDPIADTSVIEGDTLTFTITGSDPDGMNPNFIAGIQGTTSLPPNATLINNNNGSADFKFIPGYWQAGIYNIMFTAYEPGNADSQLVEITVIEAGNQNPTLDSVKARTVVERTALEIIVTSSDPDSTIPVLSVSNPLPANASFLDNGDGTGAFSFTPDETQFGTGSADTLVTFYARDDFNEIDSETVRITVIGPNLPPTLDSIRSRTVPEGNTLIFNVTATDPNGMGVTLSVGALPENATFNPTYIDNLSDTGRFEFAPGFNQAGDYQVMFYASDGLFSDTEKVQIIVEDAGNQPPNFTIIDPQTVVEGEVLTFTVEAVDPEGNDVTIRLIDTIPNSSFDESINQYSFSPDLTQGGFYEITFQAKDSADGETIFDSTDMVVRIEVVEVDSPPELDSIGSRFIYEGGRLEIEIRGSDLEEGFPRLSMNPAASNMIFKGNAKFNDYKNGTALFEFTPDFNQVESGSELISVVFYARDSIDVDSELIIITVYDVSKDSDDPGEADTLTLAGGLWDGSPEGFTVTTQIYNDSAIGAAGTGFRWSESWVKCDSVNIHLPLTVTDYKTTFISNDSLMIFVGFIFFDSTFVDSGTHNYFTAYFSYDSTEYDIDTLWENSSRISFDTARVGSMGDFGLDKRIRTGPQYSKSSQDFSLLSASQYTYVPLLRLGSIKAVFDSVSLAVYDNYQDRILASDDTIFVDGTERTYKLLVGVSNIGKMNGINMGLEISSPDGAIWMYDPQSGGLGVLSQAITAVSGSRMENHNVFWPASSGIIVNEIEINGSGTDSLVISGSAGGDESFGLEGGALESQFAISFIPSGVSGSEVKTICFDSLRIGPNWGFTDFDGITQTPPFSGRLCFPVKLIPPVSADERSSLPTEFRLEQNFPNPFNPITVIRFNIAKRSHVRLSVYNILGQQVKLLVDKVYNVGLHEVSWDGTGFGGMMLASGIYLYHIESEGITKTRKMILLK